jgi:hypothetical protein
MGFPLSRLVLNTEDAPQYGNIPDLGPVLRTCLVFKKWNANFLTHCLHSCLPVPRSSSKALEPDLLSCAILFNVLMAMLLGLYPACVKKPPFVVRVNIYARVHAILTAPSNVQQLFAVKYKSLLVFALAEYCCRLIPQLFPAERESICKAQAVDAFFQQGPAIFDVFRQECIDSGKEPWGQLLSAAQEAHDRLSRTYRSKCRLPQQPKRPPPADISPPLMAAALAAPKILQYPYHKTHDTLLHDEYAMLLGSKNLAQVSAVHALVRTELLPSTIRNQQVSLKSLKGFFLSLCFQ